MRYAIPVTDQNLAAHFTKAEKFALLDQSGDILGLFDNPTANPDSPCEQKKQIIEQLVQWGIDVLVVRNIGQRILEKLLQKEIKIFQTKDNKLPFGADGTIVIDSLTPLTSATQGKKSPNYEKKQKSGAKPHNGHRCCENKEQPSHHTSPRRVSEDCDYADNYCCRSTTTEIDY